MKVYHYARVSMDKVGEEGRKDEREQDPETQLAALRKDDAECGDVCVGTFVDRESGGSKLRPECRQMLMQIGRDKPDAIKVWALDRFSRFEPMEAVVVLYKLRGLGVHIRSHTEPYVDTTDRNPIPPEWRLIIITIIMSSAYAERIKIGKRTKSGIENKRRCPGSPTGKHELEGEACRHCGLGKDYIWKGGRPKGSRDKSERVKRWAKKPEVHVEDMFTS